MRKKYILSCIPQYLKYLKNLDQKHLKIEIIIISDDHDTKKLEKMFKDRKVNFQIVNYEYMINVSIAAVPEDELNSYKDALLMLDYENMMMLIVDDSELLFIPPLSEDSIAAINTKNKAFILIMKIEFRAIRQTNPS